MNNWKVIFETQLTLKHNNKNEFLFKIIDFLDAQSRISCKLLKNNNKLTNQDRKELAIKAKKIGRRVVKEISYIVKVDTLWQWHKEHVIDYTPKKRIIGGVGRPPTDQCTEDLICSMALLNLTWGYLRIKGELEKINIVLAKNTIRNILKKYGIEPAPDRKSRKSYELWFSKNKDSTWATDFFTTKTFNPIKKDWNYYYVLFFVHHSSKKAIIAGMTEHPTGPWVLERYDWMQNQGRSWARVEELFINDKYLIHDRDTKYTDAFIDMIESNGTECVTSYHPNMNPFAERFVKAIKDELLEQLTFDDEEKLRIALHQYTKFYNGKRPHQGLNNSVPFGDKVDMEGKITSEAKYGGLLRSYTRVAS
jgi:putative transposase